MVDTSIIMQAARTPDVNLPNILQRSAESAAAIEGLPLLRRQQEAKTQMAEQSAAQQQAQMARYPQMTPPRVMTSDGDIPVVKHSGENVPEGALAGNPVSAGIIEGIAKVVLDPTSEILTPGEILIAPFTDPGWTPLFINAAGLVMEVGGLMTHGSVVAREYGIPAVVGVLDATKSIALLVASAGIPLGLLRFASSRDLSEQDRAAGPATALVLATVTAFLIGTIGWVWSPTFASWLFGDAGRAEPFRWLAVYIAFKTIADVSFTEIRHREKAGSFVLVGVFEMAIMVGAILYFLVVKGEGLAGVMKGYALSAAVLAALLTPALLARVERRVLWSLVRPMLVFSLPLIASGLAARFLNIGDRYLITYFLGAESNAEYELAARFGGLVNTLVVQSFAAAFTVLGLKALGDEADPNFHY